MKKVKKLLMMLLAVCVLVTATSVAVPTTQAQAATKYYIKVNRTTNVVTVYNASTNKAVKAMTCSCGGSNTPLGTFYTKAKYRWKLLDGPSYGQYSTRITGSVLFHSVWYYSQSKNSQSTVQYNKLGTTASHGCVRLTVKDAKWIYDNCSVGTKVIIFAGSSSDDPLGKPETMKVSTASRTGWDPTDPDSANPYNKKQPKINLKKVARTINYGSTWKKLKNVIATSSTGSDITSDVVVKGKVNTNKLGTYKITYKVTDLLGHTTKKTIKIKVVDNKKAKITLSKTSVTKEYNSTYKVKSYMKATTVDGTNLKSKVVAYVKKPGASKYTKVTADTMILNKLGTYKIKFKVTNPHNKKKTTSKVISVKVKDTKAPILSGVVSAAEAKTGEAVNLLDGITAKKVSGKDMTSKILVYVSSDGGSTYSSALSTDEAKAYTFAEAGTYTIKYVVTNGVSNASTTKTTTYTVTDPE
ncbi:L,D-transpeptidase family protein [Eubacterium oxidoreducens]|uniref:L,D-transpeptidase catalytic domain n=1 Tax=Eubacterium oxidoreducens TaxID=1732 RepID=A0A1G6CKK9_EUBOX|nr:L,D-transpeptidase family protein [Eubacterium oxidoreducens]SDB33399.1 L,D-transpeptidase catalytic domain [Eubacterium oxidoreducens]